jgi:hypothetical protein
MRAAGVALVLIARVAAAGDDEDRDYTLVDDTIEYVTAADERTAALTTSLTSRATGTATEMPEGAGMATVRAEASVVEIVGTRQGYRFELGGDGELRTGLGDVPEHAGSWRAHAGMEDTPLFDGGPHVGGCMLRFEMGRDYAALPALRDANEWKRAPFDRSRWDAHFTFSRSRDAFSNWTGTFFQFHLASERRRQVSGDVTYQRQVIELGMEMFRVCFGLDSDLFCVRFVEGGVVDYVSSSLNPVHWYPLGVDGVPLGKRARLDARAGWLIGYYTIPGAQPVGDPDSSTATCESLGTCVSMRTVGYDLTVRDLESPNRLTLARRAYMESAGQLAIEDRAELSTTWQRRRTTLGASAYVAHTRWWTIVDDRFVREQRGITGGVDVSLSRALGKRWRFDSVLSAGRSWYGALDDTTPRPGFAAQGTLALSHELRSHWASLQRLRPAPPWI